MGPSIGEAVLLLVVGMSSVFLALALLGAMIRGMKWADEAINAHRIRSYAQKVEAQRVDEELNDEIVAVLTAAASAMMKKPVTVRTIRFLSGGPVPAWAVTGRLNIMASHAIAKRKSSS